MKLKSAKLRGGDVKKLNTSTKTELEKLQNDKHFVSVVAAFPEAFVSGKFCDVKIVCMDTSLWAHKIILGSVSPFLQTLLTNYESKEGDDVITLLLPMIKGYHMKLVLDYIYSGAMYLCGAHMQYVIQVMEVLQLKCGVSVNKIVGQSSGELIEVEHSTVTIKTDRELKPIVNGDHGLVEAKGRKLRRKSGQEPPCTIEPVKTKAVKRKRQSDVENNQFDKEPKRSLDITPVVTVTKVNDNNALKNNNKDQANPQPTKKVEEPPAFTNSDDEEDDSNDVVMVELEEEFVVEKVGAGDTALDSSNQTKTQDTEQEAPAANTALNRCSICQRTFKHYINLQVHLTGHLGVKVNIFRCSKCKKNFRNQTELDLHNRAHKAAKLLERVRKTSVAKPRVITTSGTKDKKIIRKYLKDPNVVNTVTPVKINKKDSGKKSLATTVASNAKKDLTCGLCDKSFGVKSLFLRHVKKNHPELAETLDSHSQLKTLPKINIKKCQLPQSPRSPAVTASPLPLLDTPVRTPKALTSTPKVTSAKASAKKKEKKEKSSSSSLAPELPDYYNTLECPDCDKVFIAKSIFERHLQSAKHGIYGQCNSSQDSDSTMGSPPPVQGPLLPHWTTVSPVTESGEPGHKIECHLCEQKFMRVKDLAKHREKMCQAYHT